MASGGRKRSPRVTRTCKECGNLFELPQYRITAGEGIFCGRQCASNHRSRIANYGYTLRKCLRCEREFYAKTSQVNVGRGLYCSSKCWHAERTVRQQRKKQKTFVCQCCGIVFKDKSRMYPERQFCSNACKAKASRKAVKAPSKRRWKYKQWSTAVILRDRKCVRCGATEKLQAHHIKSFDKHVDLRYDVNNGVALCVYCHHAQHPTYPLGQFTRNGGRTVRYCIVCESPYLVPKKEQQTCSRRCGQILGYQRRRRTEFDGTNAT